MNQVEKAKHFASLHVKGDPCLLYNIWDAGSAKAVAEAGAKAIATGSWSVAAAHGFEDGEAIPLALVERIVRRICSTVALPVTIDFEGGYAETPAELEVNIQRVVDAGAIGINFEDQIVSGDGLYDIAVQCDRITAIREAANQLGILLFINARTDLFLQAADKPHADLIDAAKARATAYKEAGASGFFAPGLVDERLIEGLCDHTRLPVNIMMMDSAPSIGRLAELGVSRVSFGAAPFIELMATLKEKASAAFAAVPGVC